MSDATPRRFALRRREPSATAPLVGQVPLGPGERVLAAVRTASGAALVATTRGLASVDPDLGCQWHRPWHEVNTGHWDRETESITVMWADGAKPLQVTVPEDRAFLQALRERVQASVVLSTELTLGLGRTGRVAIRKNLSTGELTEQVVLGRRTRAEDPEVAEAVAATADFLREQVGMAPR